MIKTFITKSAKETVALGEKLGGLIKRSCTIAYLGDLGAGKTCFTTGLSLGLGYTGEVNSPTFAIVNEYLGGRLDIYHFDMYRILDEDSLFALGFYDYLDNNGVIVIEWSENITDYLPEDTIFINIKTLNETTREITIDFKNNSTFLKGEL